MQRTFQIATLVIALFLLPVAGLAQTATPTPAAPAAAATANTPDGLRIAWPPPISEVHGVIDVVGTADIADQAFYRLEAIGLNADASVPENAAWIPLTTDITTPVDNGGLGSVDTTKLPDGLYNLRVIAFTGTVLEPGTDFTYVSGPIRISNGSNAADPDDDSVTPTPAPTAAPANSAPTAIAAPGVVAVNIRTCDQTDNNACPVIGTLPAGAVAAINAISSSGSGWYFITTASGLQGWVSPTVVATSGNVADLPEQQPAAPLPPPPAPPPAPTAGPPLPAPGTVAPNGIGIVGTAACGQPFNVQVNMANVGSAPSSPGTVTLQDLWVDGNQITFTGYGSYPALSPGDNYVVTIPVLVNSYPGSKHELVAINFGQQISKRYTIKQGSCGGQPQPPPPTATPQPKPPKPPKPSAKVTYQPGQCTVQPVDRAPYWNYPFGTTQAVAKKNKSYDASVGEMVNGQRWYLINPNGTQLWVRGRDVVNLPKSCQNF